MLRAFVCLAETLNLSAAARKLGVTRQTLRRNLTDFETLRGAPLLVLKERRYALTEAGEDSLAEAQAILAWCDSLQGGGRHSIRRVNGFERSHYVAEDGCSHFAQQHSLGTLASRGLPILQRMFAAWGQSLARLDHPDMDRLRPYMVVFRRTGRSWIFADVGERSAYARWFGQAYARSAMGTAFDGDQAGDAYNAFISHAYREVHDGGAIRLDHLHVHLPRGGDGHLSPVSFQRLLAGCVLPDGSQALAMLAAITNRIDIPALGGRPVPRMPDELVMDADLADELCARDAEL